MIPDYTLVCGVDRKHLKQLHWVFPTWARRKPSLLSHPMLVFYDLEQLSGEIVEELVPHPNLTTVPWPPAGVTYSGGSDKWSDPQRHKMFAGFVHVAAGYVETDYWLKLDTDVVAVGDDDWIDPDWFAEGPAVVSQAWGYTKPPGQMIELDEWVKRNPVYLGSFRLPLNLAPGPGADRLRHRRIISWCAFFGTAFTAMCAGLADLTCGEGQLPVPSQDGYMWYMAARAGLPIVRTNMKALGWEHWTAERNIREAVERAMK